MYKWISIVAIGSNIFSNKKLAELNFRFLLSNSIFINRSMCDMTSLAASSMNVFSYDFDWAPNMISKDEFDTQYNYHSTIPLHTHNDVNELSTNQKLEINQINNELNQYYSLSNEMPIIDTMNEVDYENDDVDGQWNEKFRKHKKSNNFGFSSLQKRIERVKNDIINLTNKLNSGYVQNENETINNDINSYYNLGFGNMSDNDLDLLQIEPNVKSENINKDQKTWKCPSQFNSANPYSGFSENTQKILNRLHLNEEIVINNHSDQVEINSDIDEDLEMEEDDIEFTFCTSQGGLLQGYLNKGTLPIIEEEEEIDSSSEDDTDSVRSVIINNLLIEGESMGTQRSPSLQSIEFTESESYITAISNSAGLNQNLTDKTCSSFEDADENLSDYARYSVSSHSSKESLNSYRNEKLENETLTEQTLNNNESNQDYTNTVRSNKDCSSISMNVLEGSDSDAEYDNSSWSNEDILQSMEQSDSLYEKPMKQLIKSSLPDLIESENCDRNHFYFHKNLNKSTDLDEILLQQTPSHEQSVKNRLSLSLCNLNSTKLEPKIYPSRFFQDTVSNINLLETDLDSGFVSFYQPIRETEILPSVDFSVSMTNITEEKSPLAFNSLVEKLRNKAGSIPELRIADSLSKLNVPDWFSFRQFEELERSSISESKFDYFPENTSSLTRKTSSKYQIKSNEIIPQQSKIVNSAPPMKPQLISPVILPSQKLRELSQRKLNPIQSCKARELLLPKRNMVEIS